MLQSPSLATRNRRSVATSTSADGEPRLAVATDYFAIASSGIGQGGHASTSVSIIAQQSCAKQCLSMYLRSLGELMLEQCPLSSAESSPTAIVNLKEVLENSNEPVMRYRPEFWNTSSHEQSRSVCTNTKPYKKINTFSTRRLLT